MSIINRAGEVVIDQEHLARLSIGSEAIDALEGLALEGVPLVEITIPRFTDGRAYSIARQLRERYGYVGELRATGDVLVDQLALLARVGFDSFQLRQDQSLQHARAALLSRLADQRVYQSDYSAHQQSIVELRHG
jgi:uncharacterized protein (DUF934 family)